MMIRCPAVAALAALLLLSAAADAASPAELLATIKAVGKQGQGNVAAQKAYAKLVKSDAKALPGILRAFDGANPLAVNWLRSAVEAIADRTLKSNGKLPVAELEAFIQDLKRNPRARRLAFVWLKAADAKRAEELVSEMLHDPSADLRREAVAKLIDQAKTISAEKTVVATLRKALSGAVDDDQVKVIVKSLKNFGHKVDLQQHFGFLTNWQIIGPFDNRGKKGFNVAYPPEKTLELKAKYKGQLGKVAWQTVTTKDPYGIVDIATSLKNYKGSVMYAATDFYTSKARSVQFRLGTPNAWKLWVNGKLLFAREEYHRGMVIDQYRVAARLKPGRNVVLLKILQNEQEDSWAQRYRYQIRVCDGAGSAILSQKPTSVTDD
ncbi:MAG: hypothetical protein ACE5KM_03140 [Planctomycetaceae bacterium]